jgi:hypothetical protein
MYISSKLKPMRRSPAMPIACVTLFNPPIQSRSHSSHTPNAFDSIHAALIFHCTSLDSYSFPWLPSFPLSIHPFIHFLSRKAVHPHILRYSKKKLYVLSLIRPLIYPQITQPSHLLGSRDVVHSGLKAMDQHHHHTPPQHYPLKYVSPSFAGCASGSVDAE